jgi:CRP-like cAMP-binding protein
MAAEDLPPQRHRAIHLARADPELFEGLTGEAAAEASARAVTPVVQLGPGPWLPDEDPAAHRRDLGLLVVEGILLRDVGLRRQPRAELVGKGDILRPWEHEGERASLPFTATWEVLEATTLAVLDERFSVLAGRWPAVLSKLMSRAVRRTHWLAVLGAISDLRRVDDRLLVLFWHLADRWGRVRPEGILLPVRLTHEVLARLVGAQRPSVSAALQELARAGRVQRRPDRTWLLEHEPPRVEELVGSREAGGV